MNVTEMGKVGLTGWRLTLGDRIAPPVASRSRLTEEQVKALLGAVFLLLTLLQLMKTARRVIKAGRGELEA